MGAFGRDEFRGRNPLSVPRTARTTQGLQASRRNSTPRADGSPHCSACRNRRARGSVASQGGDHGFDPKDRQRWLRRASTTLLIATRKGLWTLAGGRRAPPWKLTGPHFLGHIVHHAIADPRDGRTILAAARTGHLGPTIFRSTDRGRTWKEAAQPPAFKPGSGRTVDHSFWLDAGPRVRARRLVRGHVAAGTVPLRPTAARHGPASTASTSIRSARRGAAATRTARRTARSFTPSSSIRAIRSISTSACRAAACSSRPTAARDWTPLNKGVQALISCRSPTRRSATIRIACGCIRAIPTASISRTTAASTGSTGPPSAGRISARRCRSRWGRSAFRWSCIRAIPIRCGSSRWTARTSGRGSRRAGKPAAYRSRQRRQDLAAAGDGPAEDAGLVDGQAPGNDGGPRADSGRLLRHHERRGLGQPRRGPELEMPRAASAAHLRRRVRMSRQQAMHARRRRSRRAVMRSHPRPAALVHGGRGDRVAAAGSHATLRRRACATSTRRFRACASGSSTSRARSGRTSRCSSTASSRGDLDTPVARRGRAHDRRRACRAADRPRTLAASRIALRWRSRVASARAKTDIIRRFASTESARLRVVCSSARVIPPLKTRPIRTVLRWQVIATAAIAAVAGIVAGVHGRSRRCWAASSTWRQAWLTRWLLGLGLGTTAVPDAGSSLVAMLRAEAGKILVIVGRALAGAVDVPGRRPGGVFHGVRDHA